MSRYGLVDVYTDGCCTDNGYSGAKAGIGVWFPHYPHLNLSEPVEGRATNNTAEIQAVTRAANVAWDYGIRKLQIHTDSEFVMKCYTEWMPGWIRRNWRTVSGRPVINKEDLQLMKQVLDAFDEIRWVHVPGHAGIFGNEQADKLAQQGAWRYR